MQVSLDQPLGDLSDNQLVLRSRTGDEDALATLLERHREALERYCHYLVRRRVDAEDIYQETVVRAIARLESLDNCSAFRGWLFTIARNVAVDIFRNQRRITPWLEDERGPVAPEASPQEQVETGEEHRTVAEALDQLAPRHQRVLLLREVEGLSYAAIAEHLNLSQSAVETLLFRARRRLKEEYRKRISAIGVIESVRRTAELIGLPESTSAVPTTKMILTGVLLAAAVAATPDVWHHMAASGTHASAVHRVQRTQVRAVRRRPSAAPLRRKMAVQLDSPAPRHPAMGETRSRWEVVPSAAPLGGNRRPADAQTAHGNRKTETYSVASRSTSRPMEAMANDAAQAREMGSSRTANSRPTRYQLPDVSSMWTRPSWIRVRAAFSSGRRVSSWAVPRGHATEAASAGDRGHAHVSPSIGTQSRRRHGPKFVHSSPRISIHGVKHRLPAHFSGHAHAIVPSLRRLHVPGGAGVASRGESENRKQGYVQDRGKSGPGRPGKQNGTQGPKTNSATAQTNSSQPRNLHGSSALPGGNGRSKASQKAPHDQQPVRSKGGTPQRSARQNASRSIQAAGYVALPVSSPSPGMPGAANAKQSAGQGGAVQQPPAIASSGSGATSLIQATPGEDTVGAPPTSFVPQTSSPPGSPASSGSVAGSSLQFPGRRNGNEGGANRP